MNILDEMGVSKLSGNIYSGTNPLNVAPSVSMGFSFTDLSGRQKLFEKS